jgi:23S rRNA (cytidine1920-2'-O)/16S rRNA (cytidine1409-2'-O)-methyltransferase
MSRVPISQILLRRGIVKDLKQATALLMSGAVRVEGQIIDKAGTLVDDQINLTIKPKSPRYVSRGGDKLQGALEEFSIDPKSLVCLDLGASTGGFTDCLLKHGAARVYAFDVGKGQLDWCLRNDDRVIIRDRFNVRGISPKEIPEPVDLIVIDLSFISLTKIFPVLTAFVNSRIIALIKPQFEARPEEVEPGGIISEESKRQDVISRTIVSAQKAGFKIWDRADSSVPGPKGNVEHFVLMSLSEFSKCRASSDMGTEDL